MSFSIKSTHSRAVLHVGPNILLITGSQIPFSVQGSSAKILSLVAPVIVEVTASPYSFAAASLMGPRAEGITGSAFHLYVVFGNLYLNFVSGVTTYLLLLFCRG